MCKEYGDGKNQYVITHFPYFNREVENKFKLLLGLKMSQNEHFRIRNTWDEIHLARKISVRIVFQKTKTRPSTDNKKISRTDGKLIHFPLRLS